jgi:hypothetical protein
MIKVFLQYADSMYSGGRGSFRDLSLFIYCLVAHRLQEKEKLKVFEKIVASFKGQNLSKSQRFDIQLLLSELLFGVPSRSWSLSTLKFAREIKQASENSMKDILFKAYETLSLNELKSVETAMFTL